MDLPETQPAVTVRHDRKVHHGADAPAQVQPQAQTGRDTPGSAQIHPIGFRAGGGQLMPAAMKGSREILLHQNRMADAAGLRRIQDDADLLRLRFTRELVPLPVSHALTVDSRLPENRRYTRPWVAAFLLAVARAHAAEFGGALQVNSAVRTVEFQMRLLRTNGNAAPADGDLASPHLTGQAIDLAKKGLSSAEVGWLRAYLMPLVAAGVIDVEEEFQQACFHISVYPGYTRPTMQLPSAPIQSTSMVFTSAAALP